MSVETNGNVENKFFANLGRRVINSFEEMGSFWVLCGQSVRNMFRRPVEFAEIVKQVEYLGVRSISIALLTALFTGFVMALQFAVGLERFGAKEYVSIVVALSITRELGPVLTSVVVGGRVGAGITAEIGSMQVTEQVDAIRALGADPIKKLIVPRLWAMLIALPMLTLLADLLGIIGGLIISVYEMGINPGTYISDVSQGLDFADVFSGLAKTYVFGFGIVMIACHRGMTTSGGTEGVGQSTTRTVVVSLIFIFVTDFFLTKLFLVL
ncbi:MAG: ABC transporter permease [Candidatus Alcyoniella australis]|nr:ABC transporter permease [Candidatus Alcyoniella australis]